jgi:REP-associated tyrosine transposase
MDAARFYRRRLPHWRETEAIYFVTWRLAPGQEELSAPEREVVAAELRHRQGQRYEIYAHVIMNDHVHVLVQPMAEERLEKIVHSWKSFTAHSLQSRHGRRGRIWQGEYFDRVVRDDKEFVQKFDYIVSNPWKRWPQLADYPWVWPGNEE